MKIFHTADWQLGCAFRGFGEKAPVLREQRVATLQHALELARRERVDAFLIAGDLFEDNQVAPVLLRQVADLFTSFPEVPVFILPGNHDPISGPGCIWLRPPFAEPPPHVKVFKEAAALPLGAAWIIGNPIRQKLSTQDPSVRLAEIAATLSPESIKIGVTHGALAIEAKHQPNDHPIHLRAASRAALDYLAVGHWHTWQVLDDGRLVMPGTPEPDAFDHANGRAGALVEITAHGAPPSVRQLALAGLSWTQLQIDFQDADAGRASLEQELRGLTENATRNVVRVVMKGSATRELLARTRLWLEAALVPFAAAEILDESSLALSASEVSALSAAHPLLAQVLADLAQARAFATGRVAEVPEAVAPLSHADFQQLAGELDLDVASLDEMLFKTAADLLAAKLETATP